MITFEIKRPGSIYWSTLSRRSHNLLLPASTLYHTNGRKYLEMWFKHNNYWRRTNNDPVYKEWSSDGKLLYALTL